MRLLSATAAVGLAASLLSAQNLVPREPIIDMHVHASMSMGGQPACANTPAFLASDPAKREDGFGWKPVLR